MKSDDPKILFGEWGVKEKIVSPRCPNFLARIDDLRFAQNGRFVHPLTTRQYSIPPTTPPQTRFGRSNPPLLGPIMPPDHARRQINSVP